MPVNTEAVDPFAYTTFSYGTKSDTSFRSLWPELVDFVQYVFDVAAQQPVTSHTCQPSFELWPMAALGSTGNTAQSVEISPPEIETGIRI